MDKINQVITTALLDAKILAIYGLSPDETKPSHIVSRYMQQKGYQIVPIYPKGESVLGEKIHTNLQSVIESQGRIDILVVFRQSSAVMRVAQEVLALPKGSIKGVWLQEGIKDENAKNMLEKAGIWVIEDCCIKKYYDYLQNHKEHLS